MIKNLALIFASALISAQAVSQTTSPTDTATLELSEVVISVDYLADKHTPVTYQNIKPAYFEHKNTGQEPSFLLSETPSMTVYSDAGSYQGYSYFRMRGIDQTRLNMTLDGVPLNEPEDQGVYFSNYPDFFNSIGQVQIQRGVGTSKNGTSSYAGSLQFTSPSLLDSTRAAIGFGYGSFGTYRAFGEFNSGQKENKAIYIRASRLHSDGYRERSANTSGSAFYSAGLFMDNSSLKLTGFLATKKIKWLGSECLRKK